MVIIDLLNVSAVDISPKEKGITSFHVGLIGHTYLGRATVNMNEAVLIIIFTNQLCFTIIFLYLASFAFLVETKIEKKVNSCVQLLKKMLRYVSNPLFILPHLQKNFSTTKKNPLC